MSIVILSIFVTRPEPQFELVCPVSFRRFSSAEPGAGSLVVGLEFKNQRVFIPGLAVVAAFCGGIGLSQQIWHIAPAEPLHLQRIFYSSIPSCDFSRFGLTSRFRLIIGCGRRVLGRRIFHGWIGVLALLRG